MQSNIGQPNNFTKLIEAAALISNPGQLGQEEASVAFNVDPQSATRTVFLADLPRSTSYLDLSTYFEEKVGPCVILIKRPLFKQFYFAFVQFNSTEHAKKVLDEIKYPEIKGVKCRALKYNRPAGYSQSIGDSQKKVINFQLFVKGFPMLWTHEDLHKAFSSYGNITSVKVSIDGEYKSRGYGFVQFETLEAAQNAIKEMNGKEVGQLGEDEEKALESQPSVLTVSEYVPKQDRTGLQKPRCCTNLYVKNFPAGEYSDEQLEAQFSHFGEIVSAVVMKDENQMSKGFGFVCFKDWQDAQKAIDELGQTRDSNEEESDKKPSLYVREAKTKEQRKLELVKSTYQFKKSMQMLNLVVKNVEPQATKEEFEQFFSQFGQVTNTKLCPEAQLGFVSFVDRDSARQAKEQASRNPFHNRRLHVNFCEPRESRRIALEESFDKKAYEKSKLTQSKSQNSDLLSLINSIGLLLNMSNNGVAGNQGFTGNRNYNYNNRSDGNFQQRGPNNAYQNRGNYNNNRQQNGYQQRGNYQQRQDYPQQVNDQQHAIQQQNQATPGMPDSNYQQVSPQFPFPVGQQQMPPPTQNQQPPAMNQEAAYSQNYAEEIKAMFMTEDFKQAGLQQRREFVGSAIYKYIDQMLGPEVAPKITGMIIDLPPSDLNQSVLQFHQLQQKVRTALQLLVESNTLQNPLSTKASTFLNGGGQQQQPQPFNQPNFVPVPQQIMAVQQ